MSLFSCRFIKKQEQNLNVLKFYERHMASNTSKKVTTGTDANSKFKWSDDFIQRLYATLIITSFLGGFNTFF